MKTKEEKLRWYDAEIEKSERRYRSPDGDMADRWKTGQLREERDNLLRKKARG